MDSATATATPGARQSPAAVRPHRSTAGQQAAMMASTKNTIHIEMPGVGGFRVPLDQLAFVAGLATLTALEIVEWPVAVILGVGHILARSRHHALLRDFGEALDRA